MKPIFSWFIVALLILATATGCSDSQSLDTDDDWKTSRRDDRDRKDKDEKDKDKRDQKRSNRDRDDDYQDTELGEAMNELGNALEELGEAFNQDSQVEPVDFRDLRKLLPGSIRGMEKGKSNGERTGALGFRISQVEQTYEADNGDEKVEISIVDLGGLKNLATMGLDWLHLDVDRESDDGYERTRTYREHPVLDKCERTSRYAQCEMIAYVSGRFVVSLKSWGLEMGRLEDILEDVNIRKLESMKDDGVVEG